MNGNDKLSTGRHFLMEWWRYLQHGYVPGTGFHDHRSLLPPSGKSCPVRGGFRLIWSTRGLDPVFHCYRQRELHFFIEVTTRKAIQNMDGTKRNSRSRFRLCNQ